MVKFFRQLIKKIFAQQSHGKRSQAKCEKWLRKNAFQMLLQEAAKLPVPVPEPYRKDAVEEAARRAKASHTYTHTRHRPLLRLPLLHPETAQNISPAIVCQEQVLDEGVAGLALPKKTVYE